MDENIAPMKNPQPPPPEFPALFLAHWPTGAVLCCEKHAREMIDRGSLVGTHVTITDNTDSKKECQHCILHKRKQGLKL